MLLLRKLADRKPRADNSTVIVNGNRQINLIDGMVRGSVISAEDRAGSHGSGTAAFTACRIGLKAMFVAIGLAGHDILAAERKGCGLRVTIRPGTFAA